MLNIKMKGPKRFTLQHSNLTNNKMEGSLLCFRKLMQYKTQVGWLLLQHNTSYAPSRLEWIWSGNTLAKAISLFQHISDKCNWTLQGELTLEVIVQTLIMLPDTKNADGRWTTCNRWMVGRLEHSWPDMTIDSYVSLMAGWSKHKWSSLRQ